MQMPKPKETLAVRVESPPCVQGILVDRDREREQGISVLFVHVLADVDLLGVFPPLLGLRWQNDASRLVVPRDWSGGAPAAAALELDDGAAEL